VYLISKVGIHKSLAELDHRLGCLASNGDKQALSVHDETVRLTNCEGDRRIRLLAAHRVVHVDYLFGPQSPDRPNAIGHQARRVSRDAADIRNYAQAICVISQKIPGLIKRMTSLEGDHEVAQLG